MIKKLRDIFRYLTKVQIATLVILLVLLVALPVAIYLTQKQQEIRPRAAISGQANFHLIPAPITGTPRPPGGANIGDEVDTTVIMDLTSSSARASGVDFRVLYDKNKFDYIGFALPVFSTSQPSFTDVVLRQENQPFDDTFNYTRLVMVSRNLTPNLPSGPGIYLGTLALRAKNNGPGIIKFPDQNQDSNGVDVMQVVGVDLSASATATPGGPSNTPGGPTTTPVPRAALGPGTYDDKNVNIVYSAGWLDINGGTFGGTTFKRSNTAGASAVLNFSGKQISVLGVSGQNKGIGEIWIDGAKVANMDQYGTSGGLTVWYGPYPTSALTVGNHQLEIRVSGKKNPTATNTYVTIDAIKIQ